MSVAGTRRRTPNSAARMLGGKMATSESLAQHSGSKLQECHAPHNSGDHLPWIIGSPRVTLVCARESPMQTASLFLGGHPTSDSHHLCIFASNNKNG
eukprot:6245564-Amphidinium_carterae.1